MRWPWSHKELEVSPEVHDLLERFREGIQDLENVSGDLRQTARDLRVQMGEEQVEPHGGK